MESTQTDRLRPRSGGRLRLASRSEIASLTSWQTAFASQRKDRRYYELVEDTLRDGFDFGYLLIEDGEAFSAVQPFFVIDQDLITGVEGGVKRLVQRIRRVWPRFLFARTMMVGCAAGEGHLDGDILSQTFVAEVLARSLNRFARALNCAMVVLKEFPATYRRPLAALPRTGFARIPSMPMTTLDIAYVDFDAYMTANLSAATRGKVRRKLRTAERADPPISMSLETDVTPVIDDIYPLYLAVYERSSLRFEKLTKTFLCQIGARMPDKTRFFLWRQDQKIIAFGLCTVVRDEICHEYVGFDYEVAFKLNLYYRVFHDIITWAMAHGFKRFYSGALNYDPKWHLRQSLFPIDLYVRHTSPILNPLFRRLLPLLEPTKSDPILPNFHNYQELWD